MDSTYNGIRVGDTVKVIKHQNKLLIGKTGEVKQIASTGNVRVTIGGWNYWIFADGLENTNNFPEEQEDGTIVKYKKPLSLLDDPIVSDEKDINMYMTKSIDKIMPHVNNEFPPLPLATSVWHFFDREPKYKLGVELKSIITNQFVGPPLSVLLEYGVDNKVIEVYYRFRENNMIREEELSDDLTVWNKYVKRHIIVEAYQTHFRKLVITHNGEVWAEEGDWIIRDIDGMEYPCKKDIFERTYEEVMEDKNKEINEKNKSMGIFPLVSEKTQEMFNYKFNIGDEVVLIFALNSLSGKVVGRKFWNGMLRYEVMINNIVRTVSEDQIILKDVGEEGMYCGLCMNCGGKMAQYEFLDSTIEYKCLTCEQIQDASGAVFSRGRNIKKEDTKVVEEAIDKIVEIRNESIKEHYEDKSLMPIDPVSDAVREAEDEHDDEAILDAVGRQDREEKIMEAIEETKPVIEEKAFMYAINEEVLHDKFGKGKIIDRKMHGIPGGHTFFQYQVEFSTLDETINKRWAYEEELQSDCPL